MTKKKKKTKKKQRIVYKPKKRKTSKAKEAIIPYNTAIQEIDLQHRLVKLDYASKWASTFLKRNVSESNIAYLVQYGKVKKYVDNGAVLINLGELKNYYDSYNGKREINWKQQLGNDLNWALSFDHLREVDTTKHVHRLHPYKGKFIPQLVEYFIDKHTDNYKKDIFFKQGDIILDPFCGSGTALVQAKELGIHSIGIDISHFNCMVAETKLLDYNLTLLEDEINKIRQTIANYEVDNKIMAFEDELLALMADFNNKYFPSPDFKYRAGRGLINEAKYAKGKESEFLNTYNTLVKKYNIELNHFTSKSFLDRWYIKNVCKEINFAFEQIKKIKDKKNKKILAVILSRTIRSCRATTHSDLATLKMPQVTTYYCWKHKKICKPLFSIKEWFERYAVDTVNRLKSFQKLKTKACCAVIPADSRTVNIVDGVEKINKNFAELLEKKKIKGIFSSPPYVGQIDYHEQHAYAYDLFGFKRRDQQEIGPLFKGKGIEARASYVEGISQVLLNCKKYLSKDFDVFIVANDKFNLYPKIAEQSGMKIVNQFKRPVLNRTERDKSPYSEIIFHLKTT